MTASKRHAEKLRSEPAPAATWVAKGGNFATNQIVQATFQLPELDDQKATQWDCHADDDTGHSQHDMIIGSELLEELGVILDCDQCVMTWESSDVPMKSADCSMQDSHAMPQELTEPKQVREATSRMNRTPAATCNEADLDKITSLCAHLSSNEQDLLNKLLKKHEPLFDGTSGAWNTAPVSLELKPRSKPCHGRACPAPQAHDQLL